MASAKFFEEALRTDVDESTVNALVGTLETQLVTSTASVHQQDQQFSSINNLNNNNNEGINFVSNGSPNSQKHHGVIVNGEISSSSSSSISFNNNNTTNINSSIDNIRMDLKSNDNINNNNKTSENLMTSTESSNIIVLSSISNNNSGMVSGASGNAITTNNNFFSVSPASTSTIVTTNGNNVLNNINSSFNNSGNVNQVIVSTQQQQQHHHHHHHQYTSQQNVIINHTSSNMPNKTNEPVKLIYPSTVVTQPVTVNMNNRVTFTSQSLPNGTINLSTIASQQPQHHNQQIIQTSAAGMTLSSGAQIGIKAIAQQSQQQQQSQLQQSQPQIQHQMPQPTIVIKNQVPNQNLVGTPIMPGVQIVNMRPGTPTAQTQQKTVATVSPRVVVGNTHMVAARPTNASITLSALQNLQAAAGQSGPALLLKTENGQYQLLRVGPAPAPPSGPQSIAANQNQTIRLQTVPAAQQQSSVASTVPTCIIVNSVSYSTPVQTQTTTVQPPIASVAPVPALAQQNTGTAVVVSANTTPNNQGNLNNSKEKCRKFLANLLELSSREPKPVERNVRTLIQELIDSNVEPEEFCDRLERLLNASPQPCLIGFLKKSLPLLRQSLVTKELSIDGIKPPPHSVAFTGATTITTQIPAQIRPIIQTLPTSTPSQTQVRMITQQTPRPIGQTTITRHPNPVRIQGPTTIVTGAPRMISTSIAQIRPATTTIVQANTVQQTNPPALQPVNATTLTQATFTAGGAQIRPTMGTLPRSSPTIQIRQTTPSIIRQNAANAKANTTLTHMKVGSTQIKQISALSTTTIANNSNIISNSNSNSTNINNTTNQQLQHIQIQPQIHIQTQSIQLQHPQLQPVLQQQSQHVQPLQQQQVQLQSQQQLSQLSQQQTHPLPQQTLIQQPQQQQQQQQQQQPQPLPQTQTQLQQTQPQPLPPPLPPQQPHPQISKSTTKAQTSAASSTKAATAAKEKEKKTSSAFYQQSISSSMYGDDDINDVAAMGGVNLAEESQRILGSTELIGTQIRSCKDEVFLHLPALQNKIRSIIANYGLDEPSNEVAVLISHATQERLKNIVEKLAVIAEHRIDIIKVDPRYEVTKDVRGQIKFLEELDKAELKRHEEQEREMLMRAAKSRSKTEDPEQAKLKAKAREMQRAEMEELRQRDANVTALQAIGPRKKPKIEGDTTTQSLTIGTGVGTTGTSSQPYRPRIKRVNLRDMQFYLEQERETCRSTMLYKAYLK